MVMIMITSINLRKVVRNACEAFRPYLPGCFRSMKTFCSLPYCCCRCRRCY